MLPITLLLAVTAPLASAAVLAIVQPTPVTTTTTTTTAVAAPTATATASPPHGASPLGMKPSPTLKPIKVCVRGECFPVSHLADALKASRVGNGSQVGWST